ncbi:uncharacterized protein LOC134476331 [Cavia porcellus]|uniref:uncharacterized protein LOC134476331 n=1 Tax=Cavia porcellus TaxID=10141 RepID=UPI002FE1C284
MRAQQLCFLNLHEGGPRWPSAPGQIPATQLPFSSCPPGGALLLPESSPPSLSACGEFALLCRHPAQALKLQRSAPGFLGSLSSPWPWHGGPVGSQPRTRWPRSGPLQCTVLLYQAGAVRATVGPACSQGPWPKPEAASLLSTLASKPVLFPWVRPCFRVHTSPLCPSGKRSPVIWAPFSLRVSTKLFPGGVPRSHPLPPASTSTGGPRSPHSPRAPGAPGLLHFCLLLTLSLFCPPTPCTPFWELGEQDSLRPLPRQSERKQMRQLLSKGNFLEERYAVHRITRDPDLKTQS